MKQAPIHILYISGFGDGYDHIRRKLLGWWHYKNVTIELVPMKWSDNADFDSKFARLSQAIDKVKGKRIVLIGESAGGSMAVHMYASRPNELYKAMTICGKNTQPEKVAQHYYDKSPAFKTSMDKLNDSIGKLSDKQCSRFVSIHPIYDPVVPVNETIIPGCRTVRLWSIGHLVSIGLALTILSWKIVREAKR